MDINMTATEQVPRLCELLVEYTAWMERVGCIDGGAKSMSDSARIAAMKRPLDTLAGWANAAISAAIPADAGIELRLRLADFECVRKIVYGEG